MEVESILPLAKRSVNSDSSFSYGSVGILLYFKLCRKTIYNNIYNIYNWLIERIITDRLIFDFPLMREKKSYEYVPRTILKWLHITQSSC